jgi:hypothetical protein
MIYRIRNSVDAKVTGNVNTQVETGIYPVHIDDPNFSDKLWFEKADLTKVIFPKPILHKNARLTDLISCSIMGSSFKLLISTKLKEIFENSIHKEMQFIPATVIVKGEENRDYWFTNTYNSSPELIDFQKSEIWKDGGASRKSETKKLTINSYTDYLAIEKEIKPPVGLSIKHLALVDNIHEDFFVLHWVHGGIGYFVNEQLKSEIEAAGCTGIRFMGINERL